MKKKTVDCRDEFLSVLNNLYDKHAECQKLIDAAHTVETCRCGDVSTLARAVREGYEIKLHKVEDEISVLEDHINSASRATAFALVLPDGIVSPDGTAPHSVIDAPNTRDIFRTTVKHIERIYGKKIER